MRCDGSSSLSPSSISTVYAKMNLLLKKGDAVLEFGLPVHHASTPRLDKRIGTHVFATVARNDAGLRWTTVTAVVAHQMLWNGDVRMTSDCVAQLGRSRLQSLVMSFGRPLVCAFPCVGCGA
jgi:hypothetical protein